MRVTVCELPHEPAALAAAWAALCQHTLGYASELVQLPDFAVVYPVWESGRLDSSRWAAAGAARDSHLRYIFCGEGARSPRPRSARARDQREDAARSARADGGVG